MRVVTLELESDWALDLLMRDRGLKDEDVAKRLAAITGTSKHPKTIGRWRLSETKPTIDVDEFNALCSILRCTQAQLWSGS